MENIKFTEEYISNEKFRLTNEIDRLAREMSKLENLKHSCESQLSILSNNEPDHIEWLNNKCLNVLGAPLFTEIN